MPNDRAARLGAALAALWLVLMILAVLVFPPSLSPEPLFVMAPLIACAVMSVRATTLFGAVAVALVVPSGLWSHQWHTPQEWLRLVDVMLVAAAAVGIAVLRVHREHRFAGVATIAEVAQRALLPTLPHTAASVTVAARYQSAARDAVVGGDLYDCSLVGSRVRFLVGDVRGKGIAGVEQAARVIRAFRQSAATEDSLPDIARDMDAYLTPFLGDEDFVTAMLVDVTKPDRILVLSCGHPPPLLVRPDGSAELLTVPSGLPLGLGHNAHQVTHPWGPGDRLLLYTDGLSEARDGDGQFFPLTELGGAVAAATTTEEALEGVLAQVRRHVKGGQLVDDLALVMLTNTTALSAAGAATISYAAASNDRR